MPTLSAVSTHLHAHPGKHVNPHMCKTHRHTHTYPIYMHMCSHMQTHRCMHTHAHILHTGVQELLTVAKELGVGFLIKKIKAFPLSSAMVLLEPWCPKLTPITPKALGGREGKSEFRSTLALRWSEPRIWIHTESQSQWWKQWSAVLQPGSSWLPPVYVHPLHRMYPGNG